MSSFAIKATAAWLLFAGVVLGMVGTYLMTSAYHSFLRGELILNFLDILLRVLTFRFRSAWRLIKAVVTSGEKLGREQRELSLAGIYVLFVSFSCQAVGAAFAVRDVYRSAAEAAEALLHCH